MAGSDWGRAKDIFHRAVALPLSQQTRFVSTECAGDAGLEREVASLLDAVREMETIGRVTLGVTPGGSLEVKGLGPVEGPGTQIGPYKILRLIGEGGFGSVYLAEQSAPIRRRVALKILKLGMDTRQVVARFEQERQALALMDHPNIAKVFDAGATEAGRPYFVMELVQGESITRYCDSERLPTTARLELFREVCLAVQHAHQKGVIHRDLKPGNILVTVQDGKPVPKVIDFGIAKATREKLTEKTLFTEFRQFIGTPEYMSPEQAHPSGVDIDTRSDVYSLGVVLYELLAGVTPFDGKKLRSAAFNELVRIIREDEPPRPSTRLSALENEPDSLATIATHRRTEPASLARSLRGELDWVVMKALDKDRARRYDSAGAFAEDIGHVLTGEPVRAVPPSAVYKATKLVKRHRLAFAAGAAVLVSLVGGLAAMTYGFVEASHERDRTKISEKRAIAESKRAHTANEYTQRIITRASAFVGLDKDLTVRDLAERSAVELDAGSLATDPRSEFQQRMVLARVYHSLSKLEPALAQVHAALAARAKYPDEPEPDDAEAHLVLGTVLSDLHRLDEAERSLLTAQGLFRKVELTDHEPVHQLEYQIGVLRYEQGKLDEAAAIMRGIVAPTASASTTTPKPATTPRDELVVSARKALAEIMFAQGKLDEAIQEATGVLEHLVAMYGPNSPQAGEAAISLGVMLRQHGDFGALASRLSSAVEALTASLPSPHTSIGWAQTQLAGVMRDLGLTDRAIPLAKSGEHTARSLLGAKHPRTLESIDVLAGLMLDSGDAAEAERLFREALQGWSELSDGDAMYTSGSKIGVAQALLAQGKFDEAEVLAREAWEIRAKSLDATDWRVANASSTLGRARSGRSGGADGGEMLQAAATTLRGNPKLPHRTRIIAARAILEHLKRVGGQTQEWELALSTLTRERDEIAAKVP
jgi:serine/threonine protein kinase/tetratricopeptide (TPR) repeat protein